MRIVLLALLFGCSTENGGRRYNNYPDNIDANNIPSVLEERQNEDVNQIDAIDENTVPAIKEQRERAEVMEDH